MTLQNDLSGSKVLIVDDTVANLDILVDAIGDLYDVYAATDGEQALKMIHSDPPDLILLDVMMPGMDGFDVCRKLKEDISTRDIPVIFLTALSEVTSKTEGFSLGAVDYIQKPFEILEVKARIKTHLTLKSVSQQLRNQNQTLEDMVRERTREIIHTREATIESLATLAEFRDPETGGHIKRIQAYVGALAYELKGHARFRDVLDDETIRQITASAPLHDIGKVGVPDKVLLKAGTFTEEENLLMQKHVLYGYNTIKSAEEKLGTNSFLKVAGEIALTHHERWDGSGYPYGLKGDDIPVSGRLMAVADVYDALISKRIYKDAVSHDESVRIILNGDGRTEPEHFDPDVLDAFVRLKDDFRLIANSLRDDGAEYEALMK